MEWLGVLAHALMKPVFPMLWGWHGAGFLIVLWVGHRPLWPAVPYGLVVAVATVGLAVADKANSGIWVPLSLAAIFFATGIHFRRSLVRALHYGPFLPLHLDRAAIVCAAPFLGPVMALGVAAVVWIIRRRDHLDVLD